MKGTAFILTMTILLFLIPTMATAIEPQEKDIYLDTGGATGNLIYMEQYYSKTITNNLTLDQTRIYFNGTINNSRIKFMIIRPLDKEGNRYSESNIRAIATLDSTIILNTWYNSESVPSLTSQTSDSGTVKIIGLITMLLILIAIVITAGVIIKKLRKKEE